METSECPVYHLLRCEYTTYRSPSIREFQLTIILRKRDDCHRVFHLSVKCACKSPNAKSAHRVQCAASNVNRHDLIIRCTHFTHLHCAGASVATGRWRNLRGLSGSTVARRLIAKRVAAFFIRVSSWKTPTPTPRARRQKRATSATDSSMPIPRAARGWAARRRHLRPSPVDDLHIDRGGRDGHARTVASARCQG